MPRILRDVNMHYCTTRVRGTVHVKCTRVGFILFFCVDYVIMHYKLSPERCMLCIITFTYYRNVPFCVLW